jgi:hypothetical protein
MSGGHLLLKPRKIRREPALIERGRTEVKIGQWIGVPTSDLPLWASVVIPESLRGSIKTNLLRETDLSIEIATADDSRYKYKIVRANLESPFELTSFSPDLSSYARLLGDRVASSPVRRLRFVSDSGGANFGRSQIVFFAETNSSIRIEEPIRESLLDHFKIDSPLKIERVADGNTDLVDGKSTAGNGATNPIPVLQPGGLRMSGWIATPGPHGQALDDLYVTAGGILVRAHSVARPDVAAYFKNPDMTQCGFEANFAELRLHPGVQPVYIIGSVRKTNSLYRGNPVWIDVH